MDNHYSLLLLMLSKQDIHNMLSGKDIQHMIELKPHDSKAPYPKR